MFSNDEVSCMDLLNVKFVFDDNVLFLFFIEQIEIVSKSKYWTAEKKTSDALFAN